MADPVVDTTVVVPVQEESIFASHVDPIDVAVTTAPEQTTPVQTSTENDDERALVKRLSDENIATLQELQKLFDKVQIYEDLIDAQKSQIDELQHKVDKTGSLVEDQEVRIGELSKQVASLKKTLQRVREESSKNIFTKGYTISDDVLSDVKNVAR